MTEPLFAVWVETEGLDLSPILCTTGTLATGLLADLADRRIISAGVAVPCCKNDGDACTRDTMFDPRELDRPTEILMRSALALRITWPVDLGHEEPEYSVLFPNE